MSGRTTRRAANVVPLRPEPESTNDIVRDVEERGRRQESEILHQLQELTAILDERHHERVQTLLPIGHAMQAQTLLDWIEIGRRMLAAEGGRRA